MLNEALNLVDRFEVLIANSMSGNPGVIAEWEAARRVEKAAPAKLKAKPETGGTIASATTG